MSPITLNETYGVLPFDGVRNPSSRSNTSHKFFMPYRTEANGWVPKIGIAESAAEAAVAVQLLLSPDVYDLKFQPTTVTFKDESGKWCSYTHDLLVTFKCGHRRLIYVRNRESLTKDSTKRHIQAVAAANQKSDADDMIVVNAEDYNRVRRANLFRMYSFMTISDWEADDAVWHSARKLRTLYYMKDLFPHVGISQKRAFQACNRLVAQGLLHANLNHLLWENSRIGVAA